MKRLLIANRGEIALRILRACRECRIETVAAYTRADRDLLHLRYADDAVCIAEHSYLERQQLVSAAVSRGCDAVHPGYGFLAEDSQFASDVESAGLTFVGPAPEHITLMGDKSNARKVMKKAGVPVLPGSKGPLLDSTDASRVAAEIGYPVMLKASHGGGGRGIVIASDESELSVALASVQATASALFGSDEIYLEKYLADSRHIEIQVFGDGKGGVIHLGARECSIQRRHQKLLEEAPPPGISKSLLDDLANKCCAALGSIGYRNAGTLEFLYQDGACYFIEMNTRIQVEHPITECITGIDLVRLQLETADTGSMSVRQEDIVQRGHAIECRINAEDELYMPSPGKVEEYRPPGGPGIRVDSHLYEGYLVPHQYDSMIAKVVAWGADRDQAIERMSGALDECRIKNVTTNISLHQQVLASDAFRRGEYNTHFLDS
jgi:acetyl-CoA carboxylase biotin carboxylase subunit